MRGTYVSLLASLTSFTSLAPPCTALHRLAPSLLCALPSPHLSRSLSLLDTRVPSRSRARRFFSSRSRPAKRVLDDTPLCLRTHTTRVHDDSRHVPLRLRSRSAWARARARRPLRACAHFAANTGPGHSPTQGSTGVRSARARSALGVRSPARDAAGTGRARWACRRLFFGEVTRSRFRFGLRNPTRGR
jgi:hypothetical protein